ncbi:MAG: Rab family GTPase [Promethearchaeota archaeon]
MTSQLEYIFKVVIVGPSQVGKTCFVHRYTDNKFIGDLKQTIGVDFALKKIDVNLEDQEAQISLQLWDFAGELHYEYILPYYIKGTHIIILAYDSTNIKSFKILPRWLESVRKYVPDVPIILVSMKNDLGRTFSDKLIEEFMEKANIEFVFHTSSKTGENVEKVFQKCVDFAQKLIQ